MDQLDEPAGRTSWMDQLDGPAGWTSWTDQLNGPAGQTSSLYLKPWPVRIFEDFPFSLYIVAASESDEGLVWYLQVYKTSYVYLQVQSLHTSTHSYFFILASTKNKLCILGKFYKYTKQAMYTWTIFSLFP